MSVKIQESPVQCSVQCEDVGPDLDEDKDISELQDGVNICGQEEKEEEVKSNPVKNVVHDPNKLLSKRYFSRPEDLECVDKGGSPIEENCESPQQNVKTYCERG